MSDIEYFFQGGKGAEVARHVAYRICLLDHLKTDARFRALIGKLVPRFGLDVLYARAKREVEKTPGGVAYGSEGVDVKDSPAMLRYLIAWDDPATERGINDAMVAFVWQELKLEWPWLPRELERLMYFMCLAWLRIQVDIASEFWRAEKGVGRYQKPNDKTAQKHVEWFYRNKVKEPRETMAAIAADVHQEETTIRDAIHGVERILRVSPTIL